MSSPTLHRVHEPGRRQQGGPAAEDEAAARGPADDGHPFPVSLDGGYALPSCPRHGRGEEKIDLKSIEIQTALVKQFPEVPYYGLWLASFRIALGDTMIRQDRASQAEVELEAGLTSLSPQLEGRPETPRPHDLLALGYSKLAIALRQTGQKERAEEAARTAEEERNAARRAP